VASAHKRLSWTHKGWLVLCIVAMFIALLTVAACGNASSGGGSSTTSPTASGQPSGSTSNSAPIKIGVVTDLSGGIAADGEGLLAAVKLWANQVNAKGGLLGRQVQLLVEDGATDPKAHNEKAKKLLGESIDAYTGAILAGERLATQDVVLKANVPYLYGTFYEGGAHGDLFFCDAETPQQTIEPWIPWIVQNDGKRFYFIGSDYQWPHKLNSIAKKVLAQQGGQVVGEEYAALGTTDFASALTRIQAAKPDVLFSTVVGTDGMALQKQFYDYGLSKSIKVCGAPFVENYETGAGAKASEGVAVNFAWFRDLTDSASQAFVKEIAQVDPKVVPTTLTEHYYAIMEFYGQAVQKAGSTDPLKVKAALEGMTITAPQGQLTMRATDHHCAQDMKICVIHNGKYVLVKDLGLVQPGIDQRHDH
jgi:urea transport system substrate-binding protein